MSKKNILILGVGGTGSNAVDLLYQKIKHQGNPAGNAITAIVFDTDAGDLEKLKDAATISLADTRSVGTVCDTIGRDRLREWFPVPADGEPGNKYSAQELHKGAGQWRKKSFLALNGLFNDPSRKKKLDDALNEWIAKDPDGPFEILVVASIAGGTGSGSFIPLTLYVKNYLREKLLTCNAYAMVACPGIYAAAQANIPGATAKIHANAYAIIRELNAMNLVTNSKGNDTATVNFHLGTQDSPTGILFDSALPSFHQSERTPFKYIYLMDKLITCDSIQAHDSVLANSLYSLLCTEAGDGIDSIESNVGTTKDPRAIYAGVATSQMLYPMEEILDYAAHQKALDSIQKEWMILHNAVEKRITREMEDAKKEGESYSVSTGSYVEKFLEAKDDELSRDKSPIIDILRDALNNAVPQPDNTVRYEPTLPLYMQILENKMNALIPSAESAKGKIAMGEIEKGKLFAAKAAEKKNQDLLKDEISDYVAALNNYYRECERVCAKLERSIVDHILPMDEDSSPDEALSCLYHVLRKNSSYMHPVAAMTNLCNFRKALAELLRGCGDDVWVAKQDTVPYALMRKATNVALTPKESRDSYYIKNGFPATLFAIANNPDDYASKDTCATADLKQCREDVGASLSNMENCAVTHAKTLILEELLRRVDILIEAYRNFFKNFDKAKETLENNTTAALHKCTGVRGGIVYLGSDIESKKRAYADMAADANTPEAQAESFAAAGEGVFQAAYQTALQKYESLRSDNAPAATGKQTGLFDILFKTLISSFRKILVRTDAYAKIANKSVLEVITDMADEKTPESLRKVHQGFFQTLSENARPSLKIPATAKGPASVTVVLVSEETADYLRKHADELGLAAGNPSDSIASQRRSVSENFFSKCGITGAKIFIVDTVSPNTVYMTTVIMNVMPQQIQHFNEMAAATEKNYFSYYQEAIAHLEAGKAGGGNEEDMWNPHLGNDLHKRGRLPYINDEMESIADEKVSKAILYAFYKGLITHEKPSGQKEAFRCIAGGKSELIRQGATPVTSENLVGLFDWLRPQEELVDEWCKAFDREIDRQLNNLNSADTETEEARLEGQLSRSEDFVTAMLRDNLFRNTRGIANNEVVSKGLLEFAYVLSKSDERDAKMLLRVGYEIFVRFCAYRFNLREDEGLGKFTRICNQQTKKFMFRLMVDKTVEDSGDPLGYADKIVKFANKVEFTNAAKYGFITSLAEDPSYKPGCFCYLDNESGNGLLGTSYDLDDAMLAAARKEYATREARRAARAGEADTAAPVAESETPASEDNEQ